ncbi:MAG: hypothetical protein GWO41_16195 [candidate division Zixibacteria bacterium]|nr:hypothetical protein [candidate division Zixibacteria bacterium]NIR62617.1 hypothetical protein [candidate division Zixibacteria bacterium]NIS15396.1 hypothetical protein [candidate division Zixibacteria bacterium]NIS47284.1 hypothetical protein [candidate division Zixibacteria bacterium]NIT54233.1 hypothetical protein [candidate division Zixibacteria bacterium]
MKLLMIFCEKFAYQPRMKTLDDAPDITKGMEFNYALVGFIHLEAKDEENASYMETKLIKNLKWAARKNDSSTIILHSFAHLSESKASPELTKTIFDSAEKRLDDSGYEVSQTPFGYFLDLDLQAPGHPLARLFKEF